MPIHTLTLKPTLDAAKDLAWVNFEAVEQSGALRVKMFAENDGSLAYKLSGSTYNSAIHAFTAPQPGFMPIAAAREIVERLRKGETVTLHNVTDAHLLNLGYKAE